MISLLPKLNKGDKVGIIAPGSKVDLKKLNKGIEIIKSWQLVPIVGKHVFKKNTKYFSSTDIERADDLQNFINDDSICAIWCARGGYGSQRIVNLIDWTPILKKPKWLIGFSDVTFLLNYLANMGIPSLHGPMVTSLYRTSINSLKILKNFLFKCDFKYKLINVKILNLTKPNFEIKSKIFGGNLSLMQVCINVCDNFKNNENIIFLEDTTEYMYRIDRMIKHLSASGFFKNTKAIILGTFNNILEKNKFDYDIKEIFLETINNSIPIFYNFPAGHTSKNYPLIIGSKCIISLENKILNIEFN
ncbi:MAG: LD-carboxypeptidase [Bacteroidales bacterium]|nr:LD-carboxypeptidase [Bacteroidales bacterium]